MLAPVGVTTNIGSQSGFEVSHLIDQSGLSSPYTSGVTDFATYTAGAKHNSSDASLVWFSSTSAFGNVDFDLGGTYSVSQLALWNAGASQSWRVTGFTLFAANDAAFASSTTLGSFTAASSGSLTSINAQVYSFAATTASYIRLQITSNGSSGISGLGEVAFGAAAVPEPSSLATGAMAALVVGYGARRRARRLPTA